MQNKQFLNVRTVKIIKHGDYSFAVQEVSNSIAVYQHLFKIFRSVQMLSRIDYTENTNITNRLNLLKK